MISVIWTDFVVCGYGLILSRAPASGDCKTNVRLPEDARPGQKMKARLQDGRDVMFVVPEGCKSGGVVQVTAPIKGGVAKSNTAYEPRG